ncbi:MAG: pimeloyl-CoA dehydrogenase large subunit, partial [Pseudomonadota bacterium]
MDMNYTADEQAFRDDVRSWLEAELPKSLSAKVKGGKRLTKEDYLTWHALLRSRGFLAWHWPTE